MTDERLAEFKSRQRQMWSSFAPAATFTTPVAAKLVDFAQVKPGEKLLDVGCGTGVVAITAARQGADVCGLDLTPELLALAKANQQIAGYSEIDWTVGDAEELPYDDGYFDVVLSQFGHIFAPRPEIAIAEMRRVLKPGGRIAFATWPPEEFVGRSFTLIARRSPALLPDAAPPPLWGSVPVIMERLASGFAAPFFARGVMKVPTLSLSHLWQFMSMSVGPLQKIVERLTAEPAELEAFRSEFIELARPYFDGNLVHQNYLLTRAQAR